MGEVAVLVYQCGAYGVHVGCTCWCLCGARNGNPMVPEICVVCIVGNVW